MRQLTCGSLFAGIGGFDLGFKRAGIKTIWQVEIDEYCRRVLAKHFPEAERFTDVREVGARNLVRVDVICGGFPCQDISVASTTRTGINGERSGLWREMFRVVSELRPSYVVVENSPALLYRGIQRVLGDLASIRYDAQWRSIFAYEFGTHHERERLFLVAYPTGKRQPESWGYFNAVDPTPDAYWEANQLVSFLQRKSMPFVCGGHDGVPPRMGKRMLHGLGNAVIPQIAEWIGRRIIEAEERLSQ